jgi:branched-chain amino acid aminotransferase
MNRPYGGFFLASLLPIFTCIMKLQQYYLFNDKLHPAGTAAVGPDNRGLRYGDGLFETIRLIDGRLQMADAHFDRLLKGMNVLGFLIPAHWSAQRLSEQCVRLAAKNGHDSGARVRITVIRGNGGLYDPEHHWPLVLIQTWALPETSGRWNQNGLVLGICEGVRKSCDVLCNLKHNNYLGYVLAARQASDEKWNDALVLNTEGGICDSTIANLFIVRDSRVITPPLAEGGVAGIMRARLLAYLQMQQVPFVEERITPGDLDAADEVFLSSSIHPLRWVQSFGSRRYSAEMTFRLFREFLPTI